MAKKTIKASELVFWLSLVVKKIGDLPVYLQQDTEGNGYGTLNIKKSFFVDQDDKTKKYSHIIIQPFEEHLEFNDLVEE